MTVAVLTLSAPGWVRRFASSPVVITGDTSGAPPFATASLAGFEPPEEEVDVLGVDRSELTSAKVRVVLEPDESGAAIEAAFMHFAASLADLDLYDAADDWSLRTRLLSRGVVSHMVLDDEGLAVSFTIEAANPSVGAGVGDAARDMGDYYGGPPTGTGTGGTLGFPSLVGRQWPVAVGAQKGIPAHKMGLINPSGDGITYYTALAITGHHVADTSQSYTIYEDGEAYTATDPALEFVNGEDPAGGPIAYIRSGSTTNDFLAADGDFTVDLPGGGAGLDGGAAILGGGDVLRYFMTQSGISIDWVRSEPALRAMRSYRLGVYVDDETDALKILRDRLIKALPLIEETGPAGLWLRLADYRAIPTLLHVEEGAGLIGFTGGLVQDSDPDDMRNVFVANYDYDHHSGSFLGRVVIDETSHPGCAVSRTLYGERLNEDIDLDITADEATAARILTAYADRLSGTRYTRDALLEADLSRVTAGDVITVTSARAGWTRRRCLVRRRATQLDNEPIAVTLEPLPIYAVTRGT